MSRNEYFKERYQATAEKKKLVMAIQRVMAGKNVQDKTMQAYGWNATTINGLRQRRRTVALALEEKFGIDVGAMMKKLDDAGAAKPTDVFQRNEPLAINRTPTKPPEDYFAAERCANEVPEIGLGKLSFQEIRDLWLVDVPKIMSSGRSIQVVRDGVTVNQTYNKSTRKAHLKTLDIIRKDFAKAAWDDDAMPFLRDRPADVMNFLLNASRKQQVVLQADATAVGTENAVAGDDSSDGEEVSSRRPTGAQDRSATGRLVSRGATVTRARTKSPQLKEVTGTYTKRMGFFASTWNTSKRFKLALGTKAYDTYMGNFQSGQIGFFQAKEAEREQNTVRRSKDAYAMPSMALIKRYVPRIADAFGRDSKQYALAMAHTRLEGLRKDLENVELRNSDGKTFDGDESNRANWYNRSSGRLYIAIFKTKNAKLAQPYDFDLNADPQLKDAFDSYIAARKSNIKNLFPANTGDTLKKAFEKAGLKFNIVRNSKVVRDTGPTITDIRHAMITEAHELIKARNPRLSEKEISEQLAPTFKHTVAQNPEYLRKTFDSLDSPLAKKTFLNAAPVVPAGARRPRTRRARPAPIQEEAEEEVAESTARIESNARASTSGRDNSTPTFRRTMVAARAPAPAARKSSRATKPTTRMTESRAQRVKNRKK